MKENTIKSNEKCPVLDALTKSGYTASLKGFSAIDRYLGRNPLPYVFVETNADASNLARLFDGLRYPGSSIADGALAGDGREYYFSHWDPASCRGIEYQRPGFKLLSFYQDWCSSRFRDPEGIYPLLRLIQTKEGRQSEGQDSEAGRWWEEIWPGTNQCRAFMDGALIASRYSCEDEHHLYNVNGISQIFRSLPKGPPPKEEEQRLLLTGILSSPHPALGLELLKAGGFIEEFWPELGVLDNVDHSKEYHPEGNGWKHTLETFRYRKALPNGNVDPVRSAYDMRLSLGLLLHDVGKSSSESHGQRRFNGHAELGAIIACRFLSRLGFEEQLVEDTCYLVRNHMFPAALPRLPLIKKKEILESELFPILMELYRCDESSSFKGLDSYYESSATYRSYLRNRRNPYRSIDGKKIKKP